MVWGIAYVLHYFVALRAEPTRRALWIVGIPYALTALAFMFYLPSIGGRLVSPIALGLFAPFAPIPGALATFWFWRHEFKRAWADDPEDLPDGVQLANDDWRAGLLILGAINVIAAIKVLFRDLF